MSEFDLTKQQENFDLKPYDLKRITLDNVLFIHIKNKQNWRLCASTGANFGQNATSFQLVSKKLNSTFNSDVKTIHRILMIG
jgi:hypothetical protein